MQSAFRPLPCSCPSYSCLADNNNDGRHEHKASPTIAGPATEKSRGLGSLMIGSSPKPECRNRDDAFGRPCGFGASLLPCDASLAPPERHWRLEGPRLPRRRCLWNTDVTSAETSGRGPSSGQMPFIDAQTSRLLRCRSSPRWRCYSSALVIMNHCAGGRSLIGRSASICLRPTASARPIAAS